MFDSLKLRSALAATATAVLFTAVALGAGLISGIAGAAPGDGIAADAEGEVTVEKKIQLVVATEDGVEPLEVELGEMIPGESEAFTTPDGKSVLVTREEAGYTIDIDGKIIEVQDVPEMIGHKLLLHELHGDDGEASANSFHFITKSDIGEGDGEDHVFIKSADDSVVWVEAGEAGAHARGSVMVRVDADTDVTLDGEGGEHRVIRKVIRLGEDGEESVHAPQVRFLSGSACADAEDKMDCIEELLAAEGIEIDIQGELDGEGDPRVQVRRIQVGDGGETQIFVEKHEVRSETRTEDKP